MTSMEILGGRRDVSGGYKVDVTRGKRVSRVSSEWFSRPADERFLSLSELFASVRGRAERSWTRTVESAAIRVEASRDNADRLALVLPDSEAPVAPTHWSFGQLAALVGAPAAYLRQLPAPLAGINLQYGLTSHRAEQVKTLEADDGRVSSRRRPTISTPTCGCSAAIALSNRCASNSRRRMSSAFSGARHRLIDCRGPAVLPSGADHGSRPAGMIAARRPSRGRSGRNRRGSRNGGAAVSDQSRQR